MLSEKMRAGVYYNNNDIRVEEMAVPKIGQDEVLVKVMASGICGSDVMEWYRIKSAPRVLGHELGAEVIEVGSSVKNFAVGNRVTVTHHVPCNTCRLCLKGHHTLCDTLRSTNFDPGGFAQYLRIPAINVDRGMFKLPDSVSYNAATFIEPLGCVLRGLRIANFQPGQSVLILGSGISGLLHIHLLQSMGAGKITAVDISEGRLETAKRFGADVTIHANEDVPEQLKQGNGGRLADLVIVCTGAPPAIANAFKCADRGGNILFFGVPKPDVTIPVVIFDLWNDNISIHNTYGAAPLDLLDAIDQLSTNRNNFKDMVTHTLPLDEIKEGFQLVAKAENSIKVIIEPNK